MMNFKVKKSNLIKGLQTVGNIISDKAIKEILKNVLFEAKDGILKLKSTDIEIYIISVIKEVEIIEEGSVTIPGRAIMELVRELPSSDNLISFSLNEKNEITIKVEEVNLSTKLKGESVEAFPVQYEIDETTQVELPLKLVKDMLRKSHFAVGIDPQRKFIESILFDMFGDELRVVTTDSNRLIIVKNKIDINIENKVSLLFSKRAITEIMKYLPSDDNDDITMKLFYDIENKKALIRFGDETEIYTRLINDNYPDYMRAVPSDYDIKLDLSKSEVLKIISIVSIFSDDSRTPQIYLTLSDNKILFEGHSDSIGDAQQSLAIDYTDEVHKTSFNGKHFKECIKEIDSDIISLYLLKHEKQPLKVMPPDNDDHIIIIMPMIM